MEEVIVINCIECGEDSPVDPDGGYECPHCGNKSMLPWPVEVEGE